MLRLYINWPILYLWKRKKIHINVNILSDEITEVLNLIPQVLQNLESAGKQDVFQKCLHFVAHGHFPMGNIAFLLFLDVVAWISKPTQVR